MSGGVCDLPGERCFHPISCDERGCVKQRSAPKPAPATTPPSIMSGAVEGVALLPCPFCGCAVEIVERKARDDLMGWRTWHHVEGKHTGIGAVCPGQVQARGSRETAIAAWNTRTTPPARSYADAIEDAAKACEDQQQVFLSPQYATAQPLSSFHERFACGQCAAAIRLLSQGGKA